MEKNKILLIVDDPDTQMFLNLFLGKKFELKVFSSDKSIYQILRSGKSDLILMDISIRGRDNCLRLTRELKKSESYKNVPVIFLSAQLLERDKKAANEVGADIFLEKPVSNETLMRNISELLHLEVNG